MIGALDAEAVGRAAAVLRPVVRRTLAEGSPRLSDRAGVPVVLKREDLQLCRSYKVRGAYHRLAALAGGARAAGVVCASAGNHAQGVAYACNALGVRGRVYLPESTPAQKRRRVVELGAGLVTMQLVAGDFDGAQAAARADCVHTGAVPVHAFDDPLVVAGQGTVVTEIAEQVPQVGTVVVPVGGGGLLAGTLLWVKRHRPHVRVVGAEPAGAASMRAALAHGAPVSIAHCDPFVDGAAVPRVGVIGHQVACTLLDELVAVPEAAVCAEMVDLYQTEGIIAEPAGALASAAVSHGALRRPAGPVVCVVSGGNNDIRRYGEVLERADQLAVT